MQRIKIDLGLSIFLIYQGMVRSMKISFYKRKIYWDQCYFAYSTGSFRFRTETNALFYCQTQKPLNTRKISGMSVVLANEWFSSNRILMFCAQDFGIARGQTLRVATKNCMAWSCFSVKSSVFGHRMPHFAVILWETEVTNVGALKFQVSVWLMR